MSCGGSTAVEDTHHNLEVMDSNPAWCWAFLTCPTFLHQRSGLNESLKEVQFKN